MRSRDQLYSGQANNNSFTSENNDPKNNHPDGYLKQWTPTSVVNNVLVRVLGLRTVLYQLIASFVHKTEDKASATDLGVDQESTVNKFVATDQLPEVAVGPADFTIATVPSDGDFVADMDVFTLETVVTGKNKIYTLTPSEEFVKFVKQRTTPSESLPLFYCHAKNVDENGINLGDGSISNPFGTFDALLDRIDADTTIENYTIILLGGTFSTNRNIYRGCSFYGFPGVVINYSGTNYLLTQRTAGGVEDTNANRKHDGNFYFTGDITVNIQSGGFCDLGFYTSNEAGNGGKNIYIDISSLNVTGSYNQSGAGTSLRNFPLMPTYGLINTYNVNIRTIYAEVNHITLFEARKSSVTINDDNLLANSGTNITFTFDTITAGNNFILMATGTSAEDFYGRNIDITGKQITFNYPSSNTGGFKIFKGRFNRERKHVFRINIDAVLIASGGLITAGTPLIEKFGNDFAGGGGASKVFFIYNGTLFTYNSAFSNYSADTVMLGSPDDTYISVVFKGCSKSNSPTNLFTTISGGVEKGFAVDGTKLNVSTATPFSLINTSINN